jgi:hypothetical protein
VASGPIYILLMQGSTRNRENEGMTDNRRCMLYLVYAALSVNS